MLSVKLKASLSGETIIQDGTLPGGYVTVEINMAINLNIRIPRSRIQLYDVHGSVHRNINLTERTNKMQPCNRIYYSYVS